MSNLLSLGLNKSILDFSFLGKCVTLDILANEKRCIYIFNIDNKEVYRKGESVTSYKDVTLPLAKNMRDIIWRAFMVSATYEEINYSELIPGAKDEVIGYYLASCTTGNNPTDFMLAAAYSDKECTLQVTSVVPNFSLPWDGGYNNKNRYLRLLLIDKLVEAYKLLLPQLYPTTVSCNPECVDRGIYLSSETMGLPIVKNCTKLRVIDLKNGVDRTILNPSKADISELKVEAITKYGNDGVTPENPYQFRDLAVGITIIATNEYGSVTSKGKLAHGAIKFCPINLISFPVVADMSAAIPSTNNPDISIQISTICKSCRYQISEDPTFSDTDWSDRIMGVGGATVPFTLSDTKGSHRVYVQVLDMDNDVFSIVNNFRIDLV